MQTPVPMSDRTDPTWPVAGLSLAVGFAVADLSGVRALGGVVLAAALVWCVANWGARRLPVALIVGLVVLYAALFALSHVIADPVGTWTSVALVTVVMAAATYAVADRRWVRGRDRDRVG